MLRKAFLLLLVLILIPCISCAETQKVATEQMSNGSFLLGLVQTIVILIGLGILGYYQKRKINALEKQISTQEEVLENVKTYFDIFQLKRLKEYVKVSEETIAKQKDLEIQKLLNEMTDEIDKERNNYEYLLNEWRALAKLSIMFVYYVPRDYRERAIQDAGQSMTLSELKDDFIEHPYIVDEQMKNVMEMLTEYNKGLEAQKALSDETIEKIRQEREQK